MKTLKSLIDASGANGFVMGQAGNGSSFSENGQIIKVDECIMAQYGDVKMYELDVVHISDDGYECTFASYWITVVVEDNAFSVRLYF